MTVNTYSNHSCTLPLGSDSEESGFTRRITEGGTFHTRTVVRLERGGVQLSSKGINPMNLGRWQGRASKKDFQVHQGEGVFSSRDLGKGISGLAHHPNESLGRSP